MKQNVIIAIAMLLVVPVLTSCSKNKMPESEIYTLYSSSYPSVEGRNGIATFDLANIVEMNKGMCQETADALEAEFKVSEERKGKKGEMRYWCEKGRFKK